MGGRSEDPNKLVVVACKIPTYIRDKFAAIALLKGDIKVAKRLERLILADLDSVLSEEEKVSSPSVSQSWPLP